MRLAALALLAPIVFFAPAHIGAPAFGPKGARLATDEAQAARFGGGRTFGFRGSRGFSRPQLARPSTPYSGERPQRPAYGSPYAGGLFGGMGGLLLGGLLGGLLFGGLGRGIGLLEILLLGLGVMLLLRFLRGPREAGPRYSGRPSHSSQADPYGVGGLAESPAGAYESSGTLYRGPDIAPRGASGPAVASPGAEARPGPALGEGLAAIAQGDPSFSREAFLRQARENFLRFQEAWVARDLSPIRGLVDGDLLAECQRDLDALRREGKINRLEGVEIRGPEIAEAWQEEGFDFITARYEASLLDYVVSEASGEILGGSRTEPVRFAELWTWARKTGRNPWFLSAIEQA